MRVVLKTLAQLMIICQLMLPLKGLVQSPKIISKDGHLIFESGLDRNISFILKGKSRLNINDAYDVIDLLLQSKTGRITGPNGSSNLLAWTEEEEAAIMELMSQVNSLKVRVSGPNGVEFELRNLENDTQRASLHLSRYNNRMRRVEGRVEVLEERLAMDNCRSNPCRNGGSCFSTFGSFVCQCLSSFEGSTCEKDVNECALYAGTDLGCQNAAQCVNQFGSYSCICRPGWFGTHCTQRKGDCFQSSTWEMCGHGSCVGSNNTFGYTCICDQGWKTNGLTPACTVDVDECAESHTACVSKCINLPGSFTCGPCAAGLTGNGISCRDIDECAQQNGGCSVSPRVPCINTYGSFHCGECPLGWSGDGRNCIRNTDPNTDTSSSSSSSADIALFTCQNYNICHPQARCNEISNTVVCSCPSGMVGSGIGPNGCVPGPTNNCFDQPCKNGGTCVDNGSSFSCICPTGFVGDTCLPASNPCMPNPCHNNGVCLPITSAANSSFICQCSVGYVGKTCDSQANDCGGSLQALNGSLKYPSSSVYNHNRQCIWIIRTEESKVLNVTFHSFDLEDSTECRFDWLQVNDGPSAGALMLGRFCGAHKPLGGTIISSTNNLYLWFRSDETTSKEGFSLEWSSIQPPCGGLINVTAQGRITSPGSPNNYPKNRDCHWLLRAPNGKRLKLTFLSMQIENHDSCNFDYLEIQDAISRNVIRRFCSSVRAPPLPLPTNEANIHFHSDNIGSDTGFQMLYTLEEHVPGCGGTYTSDTGTIQSPSGDEETLSCEYEIQLEMSKSISIDFETFTMGPQDCLEVYEIDPIDTSLGLQAKYCGDYEFMPTPLTTLSNHVVLKYYAKSGAEFKLTYQSHCLHTFIAAQGTLASPQYPDPEHSEYDCTFKILTEPNMAIAVHFNDFDMHDRRMAGDENCAYTSLTIIDDMDMNNNKIGPYCGQSQPDVDLVSKTNFLTFEAKKTNHSAGRGFKLTYRTIPVEETTNCGGVYTKPGYTIKVPTDDTGTYRLNMKCYWIIMAPRGKLILLTWQSFELEASRDCQYDYVEIYDNLANREDTLSLARYCGKKLPSPIISHARMLSIIFVSDSTDTMEGFELTYEFIDGPAQCNGNIHASTGKLNSPNWPGNYTEEMDCTYVINTPPSAQVELQVEVFDLEYDEGCNSDWLEIRNGGSNRSSLIGRFCGNFSRIPHTIPSFTNQMYVRFHSNSFVSRRGFQIRWHVFSNGCGGNMVAERGVITSPHYPEPYANNAQCEWRIHVHPGSGIQLKIDDLALESANTCSFDKLELYAGSSERKKLLATLCHLEPEEMGKEYVIDNHEALVSFQTDDSNRARGFALSYTSNCNVVLNKTYGRIESPNFGLPLNQYSEDIDCSWTIKAPKGNHIKVEFMTLSFDGENHLEVLDGNATIDVRQVFNFTSEGDTLVIRQNSSVSFELEYTMVGCIEIMRKSSGRFFSPNFPKPYSNGMECLWEIVAEPGNIIELQIRKLDLEESVNCTKDALVVSPFPNTENPKERYCGSWPFGMTMNAGHQLYVKFVSDAQGNGKGFEASYTIKTGKCGGRLRLQQGVITSPNYPNNYPDNYDCEWTVEVANNHAIIFTMEELELEHHYACAIDYVEVVEEIGDETNVQLLRECGDINDREKTTWRSSSNMATVRFHSDASVTAKGFKLSFMEDCGEIITLKEPKYFILDITNSIANNRTCEWQLKARHPNERVVLHISHVQINPALSLKYRNDYDCMQMGAVAYDGSDDTAPVLRRFCVSTPSVIISSGQVLTLKVPMSIISEISAFAHRMDNGWSGFHRGLSGKVSSPYFPSPYAANGDYSWTLMPSRGNRMQITFEYMDLEDSDHCNNDYVEVRSSSDSGPLLGLFCGKRIPATIQGTSSLMVTFHSNEDIVGKGFLATYSHAMHNELNGTKGIVQSPAYPAKFHSPDLYSWRITVAKDYVVLLSIKRIVDTDMPFIEFYDGYSNLATPIDYATSLMVQSSTNILYFTSYRGPFEFEWQQLSKDEVLSNRTAEMLSELCGSQTLRVQSPLIFNSPGYPSGYAANLNCTWTIVPNDPAQHVVMSVSSMDLEEFDNCMADFLQISSSENLQHWKKLDKLCKKSTNTTQAYVGTPFLKVELTTDAAGNKTGFSSLLTTKCGSHLANRQGFINITAYKDNMASYGNKCVWTIKTRQGNRLRLIFPDAILQSSPEDTSCQTYLVVRNGMADDSPFLGKGKYCENGISDVLETSSNYAYVKFSTTGHTSFRASFRYEEIVSNSFRVVTLSEISQMEQMQTIQSPNYPHPPRAHTDYVWKVVAPMHRTIIIDFLGEFNLKQSSPEDCDLEYLQINDGASETAPVIGKYCGKRKPNSIRSSSNLLRLLYFTDTSQPEKGFQANLSISRCGGFYYEPEGVIKSPAGLKLRPNEKELECVFTVETEVGNSFKVHTDHMNLGEASEEEECKEYTHVELQQIDAFTSDFENVTNTVYLCGNTKSDILVETNKMAIRYKIRGGVHKPDGFQISYASLGTRCDETIEAENGILQTPNYPLGNRASTHCTWHLRVPKGARVRAEFLDFDIGAASNIYSYRRILFANDKKMKSVIASFVEDHPPILYSTDNTMSIDVVLTPMRKARGFKLKFSADYSMPHCRAFLEDVPIGRVGNLTFTRSNASDVLCTYEIKANFNRTMVLRVSKFDKYPQANKWSAAYCDEASPLKMYISKKRLVPHLMCRKETQPSLRLPFEASLEIHGNARNSLKELQLSYEYYQCGGIWPMRYVEEFNITEPKFDVNFTQRLECAWAVWGSYSMDKPPPFSYIMTRLQIDFSLTTDFKGNCDEEYLIIYNGPNQNSPHLGRYCAQASVQNVAVGGGVFIEFITERYNRESKFNFTVHEGSGCGGTLTYPYRQVELNYQYKINVECVWDIKAEVGYHIAVIFTYRFFIEVSANCTKDYVKFQQKNGGNEWEDLHIFCGRERPKMFNSTANELRMIFHSDADVVGHGFTVDFERNCGGVLYASDDVQRLSSPNYPGRYGNNMLCTYRIVPSAEMQRTETDNLYLRVLELEMGGSATRVCVHDNVTILTLDDDDSPVQQVLCGRKYDYEIKSRRFVTITFSTDEEQTDRGFLLEYSHNRCGGEVNKSMIIESPIDTSTQMYPSNSVCLWHVKAPPQHKIIIKFEMLDFEAEESCVNDAVRIYRGLEANESLQMSKFCGNLTGKVPIITIPQNTALIKSYSDHRDHSRGFKALVRFIPYCDGYIHLLSSNSSYNFTQFVGKYSNNLDCSWHFSTSPDRQLQIEFQTFHVQDSNGCGDDYLEVRDGPGIFSDMIGRFCGHNLPTPIVTSRHFGFLRFVSDSAGASSGFTAKVQSVPKVCGQHVVNVTSTMPATIMSPDDGTGKYPNNINCVWKIQGTRYLHLHFEQLQLQGPDANGSCSTDYVKIVNSKDTDVIDKGYGSQLIFNGLNKLPHGYKYNANYGTEHVYCGQRLPDDYYSLSKTVFVKFSTDMTNAMAGFKLKASEVQGCFRNFTGTQGRIRLVYHRDRCEVFITSPANTTLSLYYYPKRFTDYPCSYQNVEVFDARQNVSLQKLCSYIEKGSPLVTNTNELRLSVSIAGYDSELYVTYVASTEGPGCGGYLYNTLGVIASPNNGQQNTDCRWHLRVPGNMKVGLHFHKFNMGSMDTCHTDYLQLIEYETEDVSSSAKVVRQFCGEDEPVDYHSERSLVTVRFHTTHKQEGTGWVIQFNGGVGIPMW